MRGARDIQGRTLDSVPKVLEGWWYGWRLAQGSVGKVNGNLYVPYLNRNDANRNLNLNRRDERWNRNYRFLAVRYVFGFSRGLGFGSFLYYLLPPPTKHFAHFGQAFVQVPKFIAVE